MQPLQAALKSYCTTGAPEWMGDIANLLPELIRDDRLLLAIDGIQRMPRSDYPKRVRLLRQFITDSPSAKWLFTCRNLDYDSAINVPRIELLPFDNLHISQYLQLRFGANAVPDALSPESLARSRPELLLQARNPLALHILSSYYAQETRLPEDLSELHRSFIDRPEPGRSAGVRKELAALAYRLSGGQGAGPLLNLISEENLRAALETSLLEADVGVGSFPYRFTHDRFREYYAAAYLAHMLDSGQSIEYYDHFILDIWNDRVVPLAATLAERGADLVDFLLAREQVFLAADCCMLMSPTKGHLVANRVVEQLRLRLESELVIDKVRAIQALSKIAPNLLRVGGRAHALQHDASPWVRDELRKALGKGWWDAMLSGVLQMDWNYFRTVFLILLGSLPLIIPIMIAHRASNYLRVTLLPEHVLGAWGLGAVLFLCIDEMVYSFKLQRHLRWWTFFAPRVLITLLPIALLPLVGVFLIGLKSLALAIALTAVIVAFRYVALSCWRNRSSPRWRAAKSLSIIVPLALAGLCFPFLGIADDVWYAVDFFGLVVTLFFVAIISRTLTLAVDHAWIMYLRHRKGSAGEASSSVAQDRLEAIATTENPTRFGILLTASVWVRRRAMRMLGQGVPSDRLLGRLCKIERDDYVGSVGDEAARARWELELRARRDGDRPAALLAKSGAQGLLVRHDAPDGISAGRLTLQLLVYLLVLGLISLSLVRNIAAVFDDRRLVQAYTWQQLGVPGRAAELYEEMLQSDSSQRSCELLAAWFFATTPDPRFRDPARAVSLCGEIEDSTDLHERLRVDVLAEAFLAVGNPGKALETIHKVPARCRGRYMQLRTDEIELRSR